MLFLVISEPRPERPSSVTAARQSYWTWIQPLIDKGEVRSVHAKVGRGAVVLFDVPSNESLDAHLNAWADIIPATFQVHALIDPAKRKAVPGGANGVATHMATLDVATGAILAYRLFDVAYRHRSC